MSTKRRGRKETKQEPPTQFRVIDPVSLADLENIHTRKGKYPTIPPPLGQATWEDLGILARVLAWVGKQLHTALDKLNGTWYGFLLYCFTEISKCSNQTMGELLPVTYVGVLINQHALK